jgi:hypothetical protein
VRVNAKVGFEASGSLGNLTILNGVLDCPAAASDCLSADTVMFGSGSTVAITGTETVLGSSECGISESANLYFEYVPISLIENNLVVLPVVHLANISLPHPSV